MRWPGVIGVLICVGAPAMAQDSTRDTVGAIVGLAIALACIAFYFLPAIIGGKRRINASGALFFVNLLFGWTVLGWFLCLIWAASGATRWGWHQASSCGDGHSGRLDQVRFDRGEDALG